MRFNYWITNLCIIISIISAVSCRKVTNEYQSVVSLRSASGTHLCGGALILPQWVLTASHCLVSSLTNIVAGDYDLDSIDGTREQTRQVEKYYYFIGIFYAREQNIEIALVKVEEPFYMTEYVNTVYLPENNPDDSQHPAGMGYVFGWGSIDIGEEPRTNRLQRVKLPIISPTSCARYFGIESLNFGDFCAGYPNGTVTVCRGDSGSPLLQYDRTGVLRAVGIATMAPKPCNRRNRPPIFVNIALFSDYINERITLANAEDARRKKEFEFRVTRW